MLPTFVDCGVPYLSRSIALGALYVPRPQNLRGIASLRRPDA
jgi:hypothetical protein